MERIEKVFSGLTAIYGASAMSQTWEGTDLEDVKAVWEDGLRPYSGEALGAAMRALFDRDSAWPPALPEFIAIVKAEQRKIRDRDRPTALSALPDDSQAVEPERARALMADLLKGMKRVPG